MSIETYDRLTNVDIEDALDEADFDAKNNPTRYAREEVFDSIREKLKAIIRCK